MKSIESVILKQVQVDENLTFLDSLFYAFVLSETSKMASAK